MNLVKSISGRRGDGGKEREEAGKCTLMHTRMCVAGVVWRGNRESPRHTCPRVRLRSQSKPLSVLRSS